MPAHSVFISVALFGESDRRPLEILEELKIPCRFNKLGKRMTSDQVIEQIGDATILIAGTEPINQKVLAAASQLKLIARVGTGVDSVDLNEARRRGIQVVHTPDPPALAVAELTIGLMLDLLRGISKADRSVRHNTWNRHVGQRLANSTVGVIGVGRIGTRLIRQLRGGFPEIRILANDLYPTKAFADDPMVEWVEKEKLFQQSDIVSVHVPLRRLICRETLSLMKPTAFLINTARGHAVDEAALFNALSTGQIAGAALDVFENEPYKGPLIESDRCVFTCHMGSMTQDCRAQMELEVATDVSRFVRGEPLARPVPEIEYQAQLD
jgi:D-3-phosphoglycerate dehydrogenase